MFQNCLGWCQSAQDHFDQALVMWGWALSALKHLSVRGLGLWTWLTKLLVWLHCLSAALALLAKLVMLAKRSFAIFHLLFEAQQSLILPLVASGWTQQMQFLLIKILSSEWVTDVTMLRLRDRKKSRGGCTLDCFKWQEKNMQWVDYIEETKLFFLIAITTNHSVALSFFLWLWGIAQLSGCFFHV